MRFLAAAFGAALGTAAPSLAQGSTAALQFFGTGANQADRLRIPIDDDAPGADASSPCDVGAGGFTFEFWVRGALADNPGSSSGAQGSYPDARWRQGRAILDRGVANGTGRTFGVSFAGGRVRFGTGTGDGPVFDTENTLEGDILVLDGAWHHVAVARDASNGRKTIYVDGVLDITSALGVSRADLSYPDDGVPASGTSFGPWLVVGASKDDLGPAQPCFAGRVDELRVWSFARRGSEIAADMARVMPPGTQGFVGAYLFEEGAGTVVHDSSGAGSPAGVLVAGQPGNGAWSLASAGPGSVATIASAGLPAGFTRQEIADHLDEPTSMAIAPDGRIFVTLRLGVLRVVRNGVLLPTPALTVPVNGSDGERGLTAIAFDPDFAANGWFYVYATSTEPRNRVVRYTLAGDVADPASAFVVWQNPSIAGQYHHGGGLCFGADGYLYLSTGDQFSGPNSQSLANEHGKLLRFAKDGTIPADNPFVGVPGARPAIWSYGLRNPFRLVMDPADGSLWIGDVGGNSDVSYEELDRAARGANFGWPDQEGPVCYAASCAGVAFPAWHYQHNDPANPLPENGGCIIAGAFYRATQFPAEYRGNLFVGDYAGRWVRRVVFDGAGQVVAAPVFDPRPGAGPIVDLDVGPDGALYTLAYGTTGASNPEAARITRILWSGANQAPIAVATSSKADGPAPLQVQFTGSASSDPDAGPGALQYSWTFGDGGTSSLPDPVHVYATQGPFEARLSVSDGALATTSAPLAVRVGSLPDVDLRVPAAAALYRAGDTITFAGAGKDAEDGALAASALTSQVELVHLAHTHPFLGPLTGVASGSFQIPITGHEPADTHYVVRLIARDSSGLESASSVELRPAIAPVVFTTDPAGIPLAVDGSPQSTPYAFDGLSGFQHQLDAPATRLVGGILHEFWHWSDGSTSATRAWTTPHAGGTAIAQYRALTTSTSVVAAANRNAQHDAVQGQSASESGAPARIAFGRDASGAVQAGFEFRLQVPRGARIVAATLELRAADAGGDTVPVAIRAYDAATAPAFVPGSATALTAHAPLGAGSVAWTPSAWQLGDSVSSPDVASLVQAVVSRPDWNGGNILGLVIEPLAPRGLALRRVNNFASGDAPRLVVHWAPADGSAH